MSAVADIAWSRKLSGTSPGQVALWATAAAIALMAHAGAAWWLTRQPPPLLADAGEPTAIMIDLADAPMAPAAEEDQISPDEVDSVAAEAPPPPERAEPVEAVETAVAAEPVPVEAEVEAEPQQAEAVPVETVEAVETSDAAETPPETAQPAPPEEAAETEAERAEVVEAEAVEEPETERAPAADVVEAAQPEPEEAELVATEDAAAVEPETVEPVEEVDPVEAMVIAALDRPDLPVPSARPAPPPPPPARTEQPRREREETQRPRRQQAAPSRNQNRAQVRSEQAAPRAAAPRTSQGQAATVSPARWQSRLLSHLERRKRYPASARRARQQGTAQVRFTIDASGNVQSVSLARSSGVPELDQEVVAMVRRASPVPAPPPGVSRTIVVPVRFSLR